MTSLEAIKRFEGLRLTAYQDQGGVWTVGYGATGSEIVQGTVWTQAQADADLSLRVAHLEMQLLRLITVDLTQAQLTALTSLAYNIGIGAFGSSSCLAALNAGKAAEAADDILKWHFVGHTDNAGLRMRRAAERAIFLGLQ